MINCREKSKARQKRADAGICSKAPHYALIVFMKKPDHTLVTEGWVGDTPCLVTVDTVSYVTVARLGIAARWPERQQTPSFTMQTVSEYKFFYL
jgi:hypothetical protein